MQCPWLFRQFPKMWEGACFDSTGTLLLRVCDVLPIFIVFRPKSGKIRATPMAKFKQIELHDAFDDAPRPVAAMAKSFADGAHTAVHRHGRGQLLHAMRGIMRIETADAAWLVPPARALWMPPKMAHRVTMRSRVEMRTLYIDPGAARALGPPRPPGGGGGAGGAGGPSGRWRTPPPMTRLAAAAWWRASS